MIYNTGIGLRLPTVQVDSQSTVDGFSLIPLEDLARESIAYDLSDTKKLEDNYFSLRSSQDSLTSLRYDNKNQAKVIEDLKNRVGLNEKDFNLSTKEILSGFRVSDIESKLGAIMNSPYVKDMINEQTQKDLFESQIKSLKGSKMYDLALADLFSYKTGEKSGYELDIKKYTPLNYSAEFDRNILSKPPITEPEIKIDKEKGIRYQSIKSYYEPKQVENTFYNLLEDETYYNNLRVRGIVDPNMRSLQNPYGITDIGEVFLESKIEEFSTPKESIKNLANISQYERGNNNNNNDDEKLRFKGNSVSSNNANSFDKFLENRGYELLDEYTTMQLVSDDDYIVTGIDENGYIIGRKKDWSQYDENKEVNLSEMYGIDPLKPKPINDTIPEQISVWIEEKTAKDEVEDFSIPEQMPEWVKEDLKSFKTIPVSRDYGFRNNSPLNLKVPGTKDGDPNFQKFKTLEEGFEAGVRQINLYKQESPAMKGYMEKHGINDITEITLEDHINLWSPVGKENSQEVVDNYVKLVTEKLGVTKDTPLLDIDSRKLALAQSYKESPNSYITLVSKYYQGSPNEPVDGAENFDEEQFQIWGNALDSLENKK